MLTAIVSPALIWRVAVATLSCSLMTTADAVLSIVISF
jgi:hypothetical protein